MMTPGFGAKICGNNDFSVNHSVLNVPFYL